MITDLTVTNETNKPIISTMKRKCLFIWSLLLIIPLWTRAQQDMTYRVAGASCDDGQYWYLVDMSSPVYVNGIETNLQCDTWSSRGGNDGSNMTPPFMEFHRNSSSNNGSQCDMPAVKIRHQSIKGLPKGQYKISMLMRCYAETYHDVNPPSGVKLYANGVESAELCEGLAMTSYNNGVHRTFTPEIICEVGSDGLLDFGINVTEEAALTEMNWLAWKDIKLTYLNANILVAGDYYLRNKATGEWLQAGGMYGTQAVTGSHGTEVNVTKKDESTFILFTELTNKNNRNNSIRPDNNYGCAWMNEEQYDWTIEPASNDGYFTIRSEYGYLGIESNEIAIYIDNPSKDAAQWEFVSRTKRLTQLVEGTETDATFLIADPRFDVGHNDESEWVTTTSIGIGGMNYSDGNQCAEVWNNNFDISQYLTNIPNGRYQLRARGYYRFNDEGSNSNLRAREEYEKGNDDVLYAQLYAISGTTEKSSPLPSIASEIEKIAAAGLPTGNYDMPYSMYEAGLAFKEGFYPVSPLTIDVTDHTLTIGVKKTHQEGCDWTIFDDFELTLLSPGDNSDYNVDGSSSEESSIPWDKASPDHPVDCTSLIQNPDFDNKSGWSGNPSLSSTSNRIVSYGNTGVAKVTFNVNQTLQNLRNGWYRLTVKGFYRYGDVQIEEHNSYGGWNENQYNDVWAMYTIPYATITHRLGTERNLAVLFANDEQVGLPSIFDYAHEESRHSDDFETEFGWIPGSKQGASEAFAEGEYLTELMVPVTDGTMNFGVSKSLGYKYDWTCFDDFHLEYLGTEGFFYATGVQPSVEELTLNLYEEKQLSANVIPENASLGRLLWSSSNTNLVEVDNQTGYVTAKAAGTGYIYVEAVGGNKGYVTKKIPFTVKNNGGGSPSKLVINEIQVSNLDMFLDKSNNYGGYIELYNPTDKGISLGNLYISDDPDDPWKHRLNSNSGKVPAMGFAIVWFDHGSGETGNYRGNVSFKLNMDGGTISLYQDGQLLTSQTYPAATSRTSYARTTDGGAEWGVTAYPTPGRSNTSSREILLGKAERVPSPQATASGFYTMSGFKPVITGEGTIYCTTDGTVPSEENGILSNDLPTFNQTTVLRMRAFEKGKLPSPVVTRTYIQKEHNHTLPVLMVTGAPIDFFSDEIGVFVTGTNGVSGSGIEYPCNWNNEWDRSVNMQLLSKDGESLFQQDVNLSRFGGWSRSWIPHNFKLKAQKQYEGINYLEYPFFTDNKPYLKHKTLQVRNGGNDVNCRIKDAALHNIIITSGFYLDCLDYQPVHCYINGQYYGMENFREPSNKYYGLANYGIDTDEMDAMEITGGVSVKAGSRDSFDQWRNLSSSASDDETYKQIGNIVDIDEFANYMAAELYLGGDDWPGNNCKGFKGDDGKFHIVFFDVDQALRFDIGSLDRITGSSAPLMQIFKNMLSNETFRKQFIDSYCLFGGSVMQPERCQAAIDRMSAEMNPALMLEGLSTSPTADYMKRVLSKDRQETMITALRNWSYSRLNSGDIRAYNVKLTSNIEAGKLQVNGQPVPTNQFEGTLFAPVKVTASVPEGYTFKGWKTSSDEWLLKNNNTLDLSILKNSEAMNETLSIQAVYEEMANDAERLNDIAMPIKVNEVSAGNTIFASETWKRGDWIELYNTTDTPLDVTGLFLSDDTDQPLKFQIIKNSAVCNTVIPAGGHLIVWADGEGSKPEWNQLHANFKLANSNNQQVIVVSGDDFVSNNADYFNKHPEMRTFIDGLSYSAHRGDETVGRYPDGGKDFYRMGRPTIERANTLLTSDEKIGEDVNLMSLLPDMYTLQLAQGWNWISHNLYQPVALADLPQNVSRVLSQKREAYREGTKMFGNLTSMDAGTLYKIQMKAAATFSSSLLRCDGNMPIALLPGWNWVGYPVDGASTISAALSTFLADEGDKIVGQDGFATYTSGAWKGSLSTLETGKGYMFFVQKAKSLSFTQPNTRVNLFRSQRAMSRAVQRYGVDKHAYPNVMGIIGQLVIDDELLAAEPDRLTLLAYCDGDCRGIGKWSDGIIYLTVYGQGGEPLQFIAYDEMDGTMYPVVERHDFIADIMGTEQTPCLFHLGEGETTDLAELTTDNAPHITVEGYYNLSGLRMGSRGTAALLPGLYVVKYADGSFRKVYVK